MPRNTQATSRDFQELFRHNPLAASQMETIIIERLLKEAEARIEALEAVEQPKTDNPDK